MYVWYSTSKVVKVLYFFSYFFVSNYFPVNTRASFKCHDFCFNDVILDLCFLKIVFIQILYIHTYIHVIWTYVQRNVETLDSVILQHLSEIIYAVIYSCIRFIG